MDFENSKALAKLKKNNKPKDEKPIWKKRFIRLFNEVLLTTIIFLGAMIAVKLSSEVKSFVYQHVYVDTLPFTKANELYQKYLGDIFPSLWKDNSKPVFNTSLVYEESSTYYDGVALKVGKSYLVPFIESGIVVFMGEKENYGSVVIVQQTDGVDMWYGGVSTNNLKMYDYV